MAMVFDESAQDVYYYFDEQGRVCVDMYARALKILDGDNPDCWVYQILQQDNRLVHHARLIGGTNLEVKGEFSPVLNLTPRTHYNVYFDIKLMHDAHGFNHPIMFELHDQNGNVNRFPMQLMIGDTRVLVGQFISTPGFLNVAAKMYSFNNEEMSGLLVRCVTILPA